jgi:hypothetical protein
MSLGRRAQRNVAATRRVRAGKERSMNPASPETLEGRIIAHRKVLAEILVRLAQQDSTLLEALEERSVFLDHEEDPGVVEPSPEFAIEAAAADEFRMIVEAARRHMGQL